MNSSNRIAFICILLLAIFFRFWHMTEVPPGLYPDEAMNGNNAAEALETGNFRVFYTENNGREGLFINIQALFILLFGHEPWTLRIVSAIFGTLAVLGIYLLAKELFLENSKSKILNSKQITNSKFQNKKQLEFRISRDDIIALLSSFFLATSYWHITFSRIGFRGILVPFFSIFTLYFLLRAFRTGSHLSILWAGVFTGLGLYTYISFRFMPFVLAVPMGWYLWQWYRQREKQQSCAPCLVVFFLFIALIVTVPLLLYFIDHPEDIVGRSRQVSVFAGESPLREFAKSNMATIGMLFAVGDCNARHNYACLPELHPFVAIFFAIGLWIAFRALLRNRKPLNSSEESVRVLTLLVWLGIMSLPATLTREDLPHALRSIGMIPPVILFAGYGAYESYTFFIKHFNERRVAIVFLLMLVSIPLSTYYLYFSTWAKDDTTLRSFSTDVYHLSIYLRSLPPDTTKLVVTELPWPDLRPVGTPTQTIMFLTDTFTESKRQAKNIEYVAAYETEERIARALEQHERFDLFLLHNPQNEELINHLLLRFSNISVTRSEDFIRIEQMPHI